MPFLLYLFGDNKIDVMISESCYYSKQWITLLKIKLECLSGLKAQYNERNQNFLNCMRQLNSLALAGYSAGEISSLWIHTSCLYLILKHRFGSVNISISYVLCMIRWITSISKEFIVY